MDRQHLNCPDQMNYYNTCLSPVSKHSQYVVNGRSRRLHYSFHIQQTTPVKRSAGYKQAMKS